MSIKILMPTLSPEMKTGKLVRWLVEEGQQVNPGDVVAEIETEKASIEIEAVDKGKVAKLLVPDGTEGVKVNTPIALLDGDGTRTEGKSFQMRSKMVRLLKEVPSSRAKSLGGRSGPPPGAVIGRTRLAGDQGASAPKASHAAADSVGQPRTRLLIPSGTNEAEVEPIAGWLVIVKGPGRGGYCGVYVGMNSVGRDRDQRISLNLETIRSHVRSTLTLSTTRRRACSICSGAKRPAWCGWERNLSQSDRTQGMRPHPHWQDHTKVHALLWATFFLE